MRPARLPLALLLACPSLLAQTSPKPELRWTDADQLRVEGRAFAERKSTWDRLPSRAEGVVRDPVWKLSRDSAGIVVEFETDASEIHVRWELTRERMALFHMPATGASGIDLYVWHEERWRWLSCSRPSRPKQTGRLAMQIPKGMHRYRAYLPLYNGVKSLEFGVPEGAVIRAAEERREAELRAPILFYGTSITQGACASRPGMTHPAILGRRLGRETINLGFSGQGRLDLEMADFLAEVDAAVYVIDCLPNLQGKQVAERIGPFLDRLRKKRPETPILLVEDRTYGDAFFRADRRERHRAARAALRTEFDRRIASGDKHLAYLEGPLLLGDDGDATVDSSHPTDLGFMRQADAFEPKLRAFLDR